MRRSAASIAAAYKGLDVNEAIERAVRSKSPRWKETASLITAMHRLVAVMDSHLLAAIDHHRLAEWLLASYLLPDDGNSPDRFNNVWSKDLATRGRTIRNILLESGASEVAAPDATLSDTWFADLVGLSVREAKVRFGSERV